MKLFKKIFCLALSTTLLFSNTNLFAQEMSLPGTRQLIKKEIWPLLVDELEPALTELQVSYDKLIKSIMTEDPTRYRPLILEYQTNLEHASHIYSRYKGRYNAYNSFLKSEEDTEVIARLIRQYYDAGEELPKYFVLEEDILFSKLKSSIKGLGDLPHAQVAQKMLSIESDIPYMQASLLNHFHYEDMLDYHKINMRAHRLDTKSAKYIRENIKPADVLEYAYRSLSTKGKAGVDLHLQLHNSPEEIFSFIKGMKRYYKNFRNVKVPSFLKLMKTIRGMNFAARESYLLTEVTKDLTAGNIKLIKDIDAFQTTTKVPFVKRLIQGGPMIVVGSVLIAFTITALTAENSFAASSKGINNFEEIKTAIENNDPNLTMEEIMAFYQSDRTESLIANDIDHAITFANIILSTKAMEEEMDEISAQQQEQQNVEQDVNVSLQQDNQNDYGVGTLN